MRDPDRNDKLINGRVEGAQGMRTALRLAGLMFVTATALTACGSGGSSADGNLTAACNDNVAINQGFSQLLASLPPGGGSPNGPPRAPTDAQKQQIKTLYHQVMAQPVADSLANAPKEIKGDLAAAEPALRRIGDTGDPSALNDPALSPRILKIDNYFYDHCPGPKQAVTAKEYQYSGMPDRVAAGVLQLKLTNTGKEEHEITLATRKPGVTLTFDQILALPKGQGQDKVDVVNQVSASPGKPDATAVKLVPGQYILFCTIHQGTIGDKQGAGPPHFILGMKKEFTVS